MSELLDALFFRTGERDLLIVALWICIASLACLLVVNQYYWTPLSEQEKSKLSSMSCNELGRWLIDNSSRFSGKDVDVNAAYAQEKYLVCTHGGLSK